MFLAVGNVVLATGTSTASEIRGLRHTLPVTAAILIVGLFAVTGSPPFALFISEYTILSAAFATGHPWIAAVTILFLIIIFVGIAAMILEIAFGAPNLEPLGGRTDMVTRERPWLVVAPATLAALVLVLGVYMPSPLASALASAAVVLGGHAP
jgi:hydrogenase-4 component F